MALNFGLDVSFDNVGLGRNKGERKRKLIVPVIMKQMMGLPVEFLTDVPLCVSL
jgi:hypothetical protein